MKGVINVAWTLEAYIVHVEAMRVADEKYNTERDRRYTEVNVEKEKALKIKETADLAALSLARESQVYKDQQADIMREKNIAASGVYATNTDLQLMVDKIEKSLKPLFEFVSAQQGATKGSELTFGKAMALIAAFGTIAGVIAVIIKFI